MNRFTSLRALATAAAFAVALAACGGGSGTAPSAPAQNGYNPTNGIPPALQIPDWNQNVLEGASYAGPLNGGMLSVNVLVHQQNPQGLEQYARDVNDPHSGEYRQWLTPKQIGERFGASMADYQKAADYFQQQGLVVGAWPQHMLLTVSGEQAKMERAFGTTFGRFSRFGQTFVAPTSTPHFLSAIPVDAVGRLVSYEPMHSYMMNPPRVGAAVNLGYSPQVVRAAFDLNNAYAQGFNGSGVTIAIIGTGPIDTANGNAGAACNVGGATTGPEGDYDLSALTAIYGASAANVYEQCVTANGVAAGLQNSGIPTTAPNPTPLPPGATPPPGNNFFPYSNAFATPPPVTSPSCSGTLPACNPEDGEAQLDVQQASTLAPGATVDFYLAYNAADCFTYFPTPCATSGSNAGQPLIGLSEADPEIQQVIADDTADVISMSYGGGEIQQFPNGATSYQDSYYHLEFAALAAEGIAAFASSGDSGSAECLSQFGYLPQPCVSYPSGDPYVTSVGGVTAYISAFGALQGPILAWGISTSEPAGYGAAGATGGGTSTFMAAPVWQQQALSPAPTLREQPDVSMIGDPNTGVTMFSNARFGGAPNDIGGTSVAAPEMAAVWALVLSACKAHPGSGMCPASGSGHYWRLGNASPYFYTVLSGKANLPYASTIYDVLYGSNEMQTTGTPGVPVPGASAMPGYDETTGVGVPYAGHLIQAISGVSVP